jgi:uncharacterized protein YjlB
MAKPIRARTPISVESHILADDGRFPNSPYPALVYRGVFTAGQPELAASEGQLAREFEALFQAHGWPPAWRAGLYTMHHYHSSAHEVLGIFGGWVEARLGGERGPVVTLRAGDAVLIPAGVAHKNEAQSPGFRAVGAYPRGMRADMRYGREADRQVDARRLASLPPPTPDPVLGAAAAV